MPVAKKSSAKKITPRSSHGISGWIMIAKIALTTMVLIVPLLVGDWTPDRWEIHKVFVLLLAVTIAWLAWFIGQFRQPATIWRWHPMDWLVLTLGAAALIGTITAITPWTSLAGIQGSYAETLPVTLAFVSLYFLGARLFSSPRERFLLWAALLTGMGLSLLLQLSQFAGLSLLPTSFASDKLFSTMSNSSAQVAILAAIVSTVGLLLWPKTSEGWSRWGGVLVVMIGWLVLLFLGQAVAWAVFAWGMMLVVMQQASQPSRLSTRLVIIAVALAAVGMLSQFLNISGRSSLPSTAETNLSQKYSVLTAWGALTHRPVLGTGPNSWYDAFVQYRPESFNQDARWSGRYLRSGMEWTQLLATQGVVGVAAWVGLVMIVAWECWRRVGKDKGASYLIGLFMVGAVVVSATVATWSLQFLLVVWVALGMVRAKMYHEEKLPATIPLVPAMGFAIAAIAAVVIWYPASRVYASQWELGRAQNALNQKAKVEDVITQLKRAVSLDTHNADAGILLANAYLAKLQDDIQANSLNNAQQDLQLAQTTARQTVLHNPTNPAVYEAENNILNTLATYIQNPEQQANSNFVKLRALEPASPIHDVGYGQTLMVIRARAMATTSSTVPASTLQSYVQQAITAYNDALRKKSDYLQARYARADAYLSDGKYELALADLNTLLNSTPTEAIFWAGKGTVLAKLDRLDEAKQAFEQALTINGQDVSTYLAYSQALAEAKKTADAKAVLERGLKVLTNNTDLQDALKKLGA
jgi:tetratricopeptide (TPR) repeat protein